MKFGQDFTRFILPEWDRYYVDYNKLKWLVKSLPNSGKQVTASVLHEELDNHISLLQSFFELHFKQLEHAESTVCYYFGLDEQSPTIPDAGKVYRFELKYLLNTFTEFQRQLEKMQWFERVNTDGINGILAKLERSGHDTSPLGRWLTIQQSWQDRLYDRLNRVQSLTNSISNTLTLPKQTNKMSLFLNRTFRQTPNSQLPIEVLVQAICSGNGPVAAKLLASDVPTTNDQERTRALADEVLRYAAMIFPSRCAAFLSALPWGEGRGIRLELLNLCIVATGRGQFSDAVKVSQNNKLPPEELTKQGPMTILETIGLPFLDSGILLEKDRFGRQPLHYAARYGLPAVCQAIINFLKPERIKHPLLCIDNGEMTPIHLAVVENHTSTARLLINILLEGEFEAEESVCKTLLGDILHIALRSQNDEIFQQLLHSKVDFSHISRRGETALHIVAQLGRADYAALLLEKTSEQGAKFDVADFSRGWTPLFTACANGHYDVVEQFLSAGLSQERTDSLGWTAKEHAAFRGHLAVAALLERSEIRSFSGGPASQPVEKSVHDILYCSEGEKVIIATLGSTQKNRVVTAVDLLYCTSTYTPAAYDNLALVIEISAPGSASKPRRVRLPILDDKINDPFVLPIKENTRPHLVFKVFRTRTGSPAAGDVLIGSGTALLDGNSTQFGVNRQSLIRDQTVALVDMQTLSLIGSVTFTSLVAKPFPHLQTPRLVGLGQDAALPLLVGHRGAGQNVASHDYLQLGENTVESFLTAAKLGASFVEFDIQITRDLEAVTYHDFSLSESGTDIPIHDLTLDQYLHASNIQTPQGDPISMLGKAMPQGPTSRRRSHSLGGQFEAEGFHIRQRMVHTVDYKAKGFKPNTRGSCIQGSFATLKEILKELPDEIGCDIEIKYPRLREATVAGVAPVAIDLNTFVDVALEIIHLHAGKRPIILSSFTPEVCILLSLKQRAYPVLFITNAGRVPMTDMEVRAASVQVAVQFAQRWNLAGVVFACEALLLCPRLVAFVKNRKLICASYGTLNNDPQKVQLQVEAGVDVLVVDRVGVIAKALSAYRIKAIDGK